MNSAPPLPVLYRDEALVAVHKPAGLLVHRSKIDKRETIFAVQTLRNQLECPVYPLHRLDKPTSGVLLFALNSEVAALAGELFQQGRVQKTYQAVVRGWPEDSFTVRKALPEIRDKTTDGRAQADKPPQAAHTEGQVLERYQLPFPDGRFPTRRYALVALSPRTGRKHQLRRHCKSISHPLIGDTRYGNGAHNRFFRAELNCPRLLLAATELCLPHPVSAEPLVISCPPAPDFAACLNALKAHT